MSTVTDDERREVAGRLRCLAEGVDQVSAFDIAKTLRLEALSWWGYDAEDVDRLADLIDPSDTSQSCRDTVACDREALLALADEMTWCYEGAASAEGDGTVGAWVVMQYADRIRELCGEVE